jgi:hypothetical protein
MLKIKKTYTPIRYRRSVTYIILFTIIIMLSGCLFTFKSSPRINYGAFKNDPPASLAILPFTDLSDTDSAELARLSIYNALSSKNYRDIEIEKVDNVLSEIAVHSGENPMETSPQILAEKLGADALLYGTIEKVSKFYIILYAHYKVRINVRIYDTRKKTFIFTDTITTHNRNIAPAASPLGLISSFITTWWSLRKSEKIETFERLSRRLAKELPEVARQEKGTDLIIYKIDVKYTSPKLKTDDRIDVSMEGRPGKNAEFDVGNTHRDLPMKEVRPGFYKGWYRIKKGDNLDYGLIRFRLSDGKNKVEKIDYKDFFSIDTAPPSVPGILNIRSTKKYFHISITPPEDEDFDHFTLFRTDNPKDGYRKISELKQPYYKDKKLKEGKKYHYRIHSTDKLGNKSALSIDFEYQAPRSGPIEINRDLMSYTKLHAYSSPYIINRPIRVMEGNILDIEPGVKIHFGKNGSLIIEGELMASGDKKNKIVFTGEEGWPGIRIRSKGEMSRSRLSCAIIENAYHGIHINRGRLEAESLEIKNCLIGIKAEKNSSIRVVKSKFKKNNTAFSSNTRKTILKECDFIKNKFMTEFDGAPQKQKIPWVRNFTYFKY